MVSSLFPPQINKSAALRILGFASRIERLRLLDTGAIQVTYWVGSNRCLTFLSRKCFDRDATEFRQHGARFVRVKRWSAGSYENTHFDCKTPDSPRSYIVRLLGNAVSCECPDYQKQTTRPRQSCKHALAVLNFLGHNSLSDFIAAKEAAVTARILAEADAERESIFAF